MAQTINDSSYEFLDQDPQYLTSDTIPIRILDGEYKGVEFKFQKVMLGLSGEDLNVNFDVDILKAPDNITIDLSDQKLIDFLGEILYDIIVNRADMETQLTSATEPTDLEADVHEEPHGKNHP